MSAIEVSGEGRVTRIRLPPMPLDTPELEALAHVLEDRALDAECRAVVLIGTDGLFCAGAALPEQPEVEADLARTRAIAQVLIACETSPKPVVAVVDGLATSFGVGLVAACDLVLATPRSRFVVSALRQGVVPAVLGPYLVRCIGERHALRLLLEGEPLDAAEAARLGLVHEVVGENAIAARTAALLAAIARAGPQASGEAKAMLEIVRTTPHGSLLLGAMVRMQAESLGTAEAVEGRQAAAQGRAPRWS